MATGKGPLRIAIEDFLSTFKLGEIINEWWTEWGEKQEDAILESHNDTLSQIQGVEGLPDVFKQLGLKKRTKSLQGGIATALGFATSIGMSAASAFMGPIMRLLNYAMDKRLRTSRVDPVAAWQISRRTPEFSGSALLGLQELGWSDDLIQAFRVLTEPLLSEGDLLTMYLREEVTSSELETELGLRGWTSERINLLKKGREIIPSPGELVQLAVREAFDDGVASQFGYDEAFPTEAAEWAEKQGLSADWMKKIWRSHWALPSVGQGFEMFQRLRPGTTDNPMSEDDLALLLRALDIPSFWRGRLTEIAYNPLTSVDVRRMYATGTLDADGVYQNYLDFGYSPKNAQLMTDFTIKYETGAEKDVGRTAIIKGFKKGLFSESEAVGSLRSIGYNDQAAGFYVAIAKMELVEGQIDAELKFIKTLYLANEIGESEIYDHLGPLDMPTEQVQKLVNSWAVEKRRKVRLPTETELENFYKLGMIEQADYRQGLVDKNYKEDTISWFIEQADMDIVAEAAKTLERENKEKARIEEATILDEHRLAVAAINVQIAEHNADIASIKLAAHDVDDPVTLDDMKKAVDTLKLLIKERQLAKAKLTLERLA